MSDHSQYKKLSLLFTFYSMHWLFRLLHDKYTPGLFLRTDVKYLFWSFMKSIVLLVKAFSPFMSKLKQKDQKSHFN